MIGIFILSVLGSYSLISKNNDQFKLKNFQTKIISNQIVTEELIDSETVNEIINNAIVSVVDKKKEQLKAQIQIKEKKVVNNIIKVINTEDVENLDFVNKDNEIIKKKTKDNNNEIKFVKIVKKIKIESEEIKKSKTYKQKKSEDLFDEAYFNINGKDPIQLRKISKIIKISTNNLVALLDNIKMPKEEDLYLVDFDESKIEPIKKENTKIYRKPTVDRISTALAATEKSKDEKSKDQNEMDLTFYDYSKSEEEAESQKAPTMKEKIESLMKVSVSSHPKKESTTERMVNPLVTQNSVNPNLPVKVDVPKENNKSKQPRLPKLPKLPTNNTVASNNDTRVDDGIKGLDFNAVEEDINYIAYGKLQAFGVFNNKLEKIYDYDIKYSDDLDVRANSDSSGEYSFKYKINSDYSIRRITILSKSFIPTSMEQVLREGNNSLKITLISRDQLDYIVNSQNLRGLGAHALIELDNMTEDAELGVDTRYENKLYLDNKFRVVNREDSDFNYILFVGVEPGNHIMSYKTYKNEVTNKIVHLSDDEIYYDMNFYREEKSDIFELYEEHLLTKEHLALDLTSNDIMDINYDSEVKMMSLNRAKINKALYPHTTRSYFQLKHLREPIFIGRYKNKKVVVPSESYMREVMYGFNERLSDQDCFIQINLSKEAKEFSINGISQNRMMRPLVKVLDSDGVFYEDLSNESKRIFILGREQGMINLKIKYADNSVDFLQSYCAEKTYLVEQL